MKKIFLLLSVAVILLAIFNVKLINRVKSSVENLSQLPQKRSQKKHIDLSKLNKTEWVNYWMRKLTLEEKVAQMIMPDARGIFSINHSPISRGRSRPN